MPESHEFRDYADLDASTKNVAEQYRNVSDVLKAANEAAEIAGVAENARKTEAIADVVAHVGEQTIDMVHLRVDPNPRRTAEHTGRAADAMEDVRDVVTSLLDLTRANLELAQSQRDTAERTATFTKWMSVISLIVSVASLGAAIAAVALR